MFGLLCLALASQAGGPDPAADFDEDGVPDVQDDCPTDPMSGAANGCPPAPGPSPAPARPGGPPPKARLDGDQVRLLEPIAFGTASATILPASGPLLRDVAAALKSLPSNRAVQVEGHTDDRGSRVQNVRLSQRRAEAVVARLVELGVDGARMTAVGVGPDRPVATNATADGRAKNRRVEIRIVDRPSPP